MTTKTLNEKELSIIIYELANCANTCLESVSALKEINQIKFKKAISLTNDCATTCRRGISLLQDGKGSAITFLAACRDICQWCEKENKLHNNDHCSKVVIACRSCVDFLNKTL
jgi:hypothetical protein